MQEIFLPFFGKSFVFISLMSAHSDAVCTSQAEIGRMSEGESGGRGKLGEDKKAKYEEKTF